ncbi:trans-aconitate 2-methyltransferase [Asanoa ishikariensis]|uniref:Trans-aconitate 2-methyltransferase n=1 Tax=Asanoa ishikariensis TaxID=137265 RepID=A0A1H3S917_9ACTN|nr:trans-aconitate 2-methyltransferase [Asanoa ishikariensis]GIF70264.1 trans-aconitate 2-methyltransferase [Asanoa ishikariensis]SDZ34593.1 trans-aconitate 2-methyltransferase [Asanoa ishikariensis]
MWDPAVYGRFGDERSRPFHELVARIPAEAPRQVVDLGCGPGTLTATLAARWPSALVRGIDSSAEMIASARALDAPVDFTVGDLREFTPSPGVDVLVSNAALQWVPDHEALLHRWVAALPAGAWLAFQVPGNFSSPAHDAVYALAESPRWKSVLGGVARRMAVPTATDYAASLASACAVDAWETTYVHLLPGNSADHPVLAWLEGTALRPIRAAFGADEAGWAAYRAELGERLAAAYPIRHDRAFFPFRRVFVVAHVQGALS